ncbi:MAG: hypothetical protein GYA55_04530 [SAR324 cluster bacterium]|uniref:Uncharacterized protein n=1 Tax=SAR324 cluster bacterium TaxID=2024889 RepID=A0A7X9IJU1_9DELT|nr:hypothetical protein [SAR324 cluster bacterium]
MAPDHQKMNWVYLRGGGHPGDGEPSEGSILQPQTKPANFEALKFEALKSSYGERVWYGGQDTSNSDGPIVWLQMFEVDQGSEAILIRLAFSKEIAGGSEGIRAKCYMIREDVSPEQRQRILDVAVLLLGAKEEGAKELKKLLREGVLSEDKATAQEVRGFIPEEEKLLPSSKAREIINVTDLLLESKDLYESPKEFLKFDLKGSRFFQIK